MWFQHTIFIRQLYFNQFGKKSFPTLKNETCTFIALTSRPFPSWSQTLNSLHTIYFVCVMISLTQHRTFRVLLYCIHSSPFLCPKANILVPFFCFSVYYSLFVYFLFFSAFFLILSPHSSVVLNSVLGLCPWLTTVCILCLLFRWFWLF